jgi:hypothetical protein
LEFKRKITHDGTFIEKRAAIREFKTEVYEYANGALVHTLLSDVEAILRERNIPNYQDIIATASIRAIAPSPNLIQDPEVLESC